MTRSAVGFISLSLFVLSVSTVSASDGKEEDGKSGFFTPSPGFYDSVSDDTKGPRETPNLFKQIGGDFRNVFTTKENLLIIGVGLGAALAAHPYDQQISQSRFNTELFEDSNLDVAFESASSRKIQASRLLGAIWFGLRL
jgi:hypothetical protein